MRLLRLSLLAALLALIGGVPASLAQERFGGLSGTVTDTSKAPVPGATITITNTQTNASRTTVSGADG